MAFLRRTDLRINMMSDRAKNYRSNIARTLLLASGFVSVFLAFLYNEFLLAPFDPNPPLLDVTVQKIRFVQIYFLLSGLLLISLSEFVKRISWLEAFVKKPLVTNLFLSALVILLPLSILEYSLKPFMTVTTIYMTDVDLGWRLRPNSEDAYGGVVVKINSKGLRGPELDYAKPSDVIRILYLGDSVTFGYGLGSYKETFPYLIETVLEDRLAYEIETINAGVGGYSPWQEFVYLASEGTKYDPDLLVVSFVLNDVTEKFGLRKYGGSGEGAQLARTVSSTFDWLFTKSSILHFARKIGARIRFGEDVPDGAKQKEVLDVKHLAYHPDRPDVQKAWKITLEELDQIFAFSKEKDIPILLVFFPYTFQFENAPALSTPQKIVSQYALDHGVPVVDLLPLLSKKAKERGVTAERFFLGENHLSTVGSEVAAEIIADFIQQGGFIRWANPKGY